MAESDLDCEENFILDWSNLTEKVIMELFVSSKTDLILGYVALPVIVGFGLLFNFSFLVTFARTKWMHSRLYYYLVHLAVVDSMLLTFAYVQLLVSHLISPLNFTNDAFGDFGCIFSLITETLYYLSLIIVTTISLERYSAICHPLRHRKGATKYRIIKVGLFAWIFSFTVAALQLPHRYKNQLYCIIYPEEMEQLHEYPRTARICSAAVPWYRTIYQVLQFVVFYSSLVVNVYCYFRIICALSKRSDVGTTERASSQTSGKAVKDAQISATRMIIVNAGVYFFCNSPIQLFLTVDLFLLSVGLPLQISHSFLLPFVSILQVLLYLNSAVNPLIYTVTNARYRSAVLETFGCAINKAQAHTSISNHGAPAKTATETESMVNIS